MEVELADDRNELVEVNVKMPAQLRDHFAAVCARLNLKLDDVVCELVEKWILRLTIELLEESAENEDPSAGGKPAKG